MESMENKNNIILWSNEEDYPINIIPHQSVKEFYHHLGLDLLGSVYLTSGVEMMSLSRLTNMECSALYHAKQSC